MRLDFYLPKHNIAIECQGEQHFRAVKYFGGEKRLKDAQKCDKLKKSLCEQHGISIHYINYNDTENDIQMKLNNSCHAV